MRTLRTKHVSEPAKRSQPHLGILGARDERGSLLATRRGDPRVALIGDVLPKESPFELKPVAGRGVIAGRIGGAQPSACQSYVRRGAIRLRADVDEHAQVEARAVPPGTWALELRVDGLLRASLEGVAVGSRDVVISPSR